MRVSAPLPASKPVARISTSNSCTLPSEVFTPSGTFAAHLGVLGAAHRWQVEVRRGKVSLVDSLDDATDRHVAEIDEIQGHKEQELMEV